MCFTLLAAGHRIEPLFAPLMYYNQIVGSLIKIKVTFFPDRQSWTRQKTTLRRNLDGFHAWFNVWSSRIVLFAAVNVFAAIVVTLVLFKSRYG
jgi:glycosyltransferase Alg8